MKKKRKRLKNVTKHIIRSALFSFFFTFHWNNHFINVKVEKGVLHIKFFYSLRELLYFFYFLLKKNIKKKTEKQKNIKYIMIFFKLK